jgi:hypothetical protein
MKLAEASHFFADFPEPGSVFHISSVGCWLPFSTVTVIPTSMPCSEKMYFSYLLLFSCADMGGSSIYISV